MGGGRVSAPVRPAAYEEQISKPPVDDDLGFDVDELVKKIDAKIAELEEEERRNKAGASATPTTKPQPIINKPVAVPKQPLPTETPSSDGGAVSSIDEFLSKAPVNETPMPKIKPLEEKVVEPINSVVKPKDNLALSDEENDDDDFFDDFFDN